MQGERSEADSVSRSSIEQTSEPSAGPSSMVPSKRAVSQRAGSMPEIDAISRPLSAEVDGGVSISLAEALERAAVWTPDILIAHERVSASEADVDVARAGLLPSLTLGTSLFRNEGRVQATAGDFLDVDKQNGYLGAGLEIVFDPGEVIYEARAAEQRSRASRHGMRSVANAVWRNTAWRYFDLIESYARLSIAEGARRQAEELVDLQQARFEGGRGLEVDLLRARARLAQAERGVIMANNLTQVASASLAEILSMDAGQQLVPSESEIQALELVPELPLELLRERAMREHPELARLRSLVRAETEEEHGSSRAWMIPELRLGASYGGFGNNYGDLKDQEVYRAALLWTIAPTISGERDRARAERREAHFELEKLRHGIDADVVRAKADVHAARQQIIVAVVGRDAASEAYTLAVERRRQGAGLLIEVLDAELESVRAETALVASLSAFNRAQYDLLLAVGSGGL